MTMPDPDTGKFGKPVWFHLVAALREIRDEVAQYVGVDDSHDGDCASTDTSRHPDHRKCDCHPVADKPNLAMRVDEIARKALEES